MSSVNILRAVENIKSGTTTYTPIVEVIVNAIQAIDSKNEKNGEISILVLRSPQSDLISGISDVIGFEIIDNGVGFTDANRQSFDTLYSDYKVESGGKGFGRFTCLKYFENLSVESIYQDDDGAFKKCTFSMGKGNDIIENEKIESSEHKTSFSTIKLFSVKKGKIFDKKIQTIARNLVEKLLPYFICNDYQCPRITISEKDGTGKCILNDYVSSKSGEIKEIPISISKFTLSEHSKEREFSVRVFKFYSPRGHHSKIGLVAHQREVTNTAIHSHIPEFIEEFYEKNDGKSDKNYIIKAYVLGDYLDENVSIERGGFEFQKDSDLTGISQSQIEIAALEIAKISVEQDILSRKEKKKELVQNYIENQAPWHKTTLKDLDLSDMPFHANDETIEATLHKAKFFQEIKIKNKVNTLLERSDIDDINTNASEIVKLISETSKSELIHYIALRLKVLDIFEKSLSLNEEGKYSSEGVVHDIIFPRRSDSEKTSFSDHNLWIIDERLNFTHYISSDLPLNGGRSERPDLLSYGTRVSFRGENEPSNPITIFEFKKPQRDDFANPSSDEDPVQQIIRYVNSIKNGEFKTPEGRKILVSENTPFYGYVVCDITPKVENWLQNEKDFKPMPDRLGWFQWRSNINLYIEVISWDKVLKDAKMRNKVFFHKLGIELL
jgi:hypothetical protein